MFLGRKIAEGKYRECFEISDDPSLCAKVQKNVIERRFLGFRVKYSLRIYTLLKFLIPDLNERELDIINDLPDELREYLPPISRLERDDGNGETRLVMTRSIDYDGSYSKVVSENGVIRNEMFWQHIEKIMNIMIQNNIFLFDITGRNMIVRKLSPTSWQPILIDLKSLDRSMYPYQLNLVLKSEREKKFHRKLRKFKDLYMPKDFD